MMPLASRVTYQLPVPTTDWNNVRVAPNGEIIMAGNERIRARFTVGALGYQEGFETDVTNDTYLSNQVEEDNVDDDEPVVIIEGRPNNDPVIDNVDNHYDGSVDTPHYDTEPDDDIESMNDEAEEDDNNATIENDNDSNGRGVTNVEHLGNI